MARPGRHGTQFGVMMRNLSAMGDGALLVPAALMLLAYLLAGGRARTAGAVAAAILACGAATLAAKLLFRACGAAITDLDVVSPSGHASFATLFYGALAILASHARPRWQAGTIAAAAAVLIAGIAISRVATGSHSAEEVVFGLGIGIASLGLFRTLHARIGGPGLPLLHLAAAPALALALTLLIGRHLSAEHWIEEVARRASLTFDLCREPGGRTAHLGPLAEPSWFRPR